MMHNKKILLIFLSIFIILTFSSAVTATNTTYGENTIITVDGSSVNQMNEPTIQAAIDNASAGDTIEITGTSYEHCHFVVDKPLNIISTMGTKMSTCPSNIKESDGVGIFYFNENATGSVLSGFTFTNDAAKRGSVNPYAIYINGADDLSIINCKITEVTDGPGIFITNAANINMDEISVKKSVKGIHITNSNNINIKNSVFERNSNAGIYIGKNVEATNIINNTIYRNNHIGIYYESCVNSNVTCNNITSNRDDNVQSRAKLGYGILVNSTMSTLKIKGNNIFENGNYGILHTSLAVPSIDAIKEYADFDKIEEIDENIFTHHLTRCVFSQSLVGGTYTVYVGSNFYANEQFCPSTYYEPGILRNGARDLVFSEIQEVSPGIYNISFVKKHTGEIAEYLNTTHVTFFLNKQTTRASIEANDQAKVINVIEGSATVNFTDAKYKSKGNTITVISTGFGAIDPKITSDRLSAIYNVSDSSIPEGSVIMESELIGDNITDYYGSSIPYIVTLKDIDGNSLSGQKIIFNLNGREYNRTTNNNGTARMNINFNSGKYNVSARFEGNDEYPASHTNNTITILPTIESADITKIFRNSTQYKATFFDSKGNPLINQSVSFNINGVLYYRNTNKNGTARLNINLEQNEYTITATNPVTSEKKSNTVTVLPTITENNDVVKYYRNASQYIVKLLDSKGNPVSKTNVTFNINGVFYTRTSNQNGYARLNLNLQPGDYIITAEYNKCRVSNNIKILPVLSAEDLVKEYDILEQFKVNLVDGQGNPLAGKKVTFNVNGVFYDRTTNNKGIASLNIKLPVNKYIITSSYNGANIANNIEVLNTVTVAPNLSNNEIQNILDSANEKVAVRFTGKEYSNIALNINKEILLNGNNAILNGKSNSTVITVNKDNVIVKNTNINANSGSGIVLNNVKNTNIKNNVINSTLDKNKMDKYNSAEELLPGNGISVSGSKNKLLDNNISYFKNGVYLNNAKDNTIKENTIIKNNFGIEFAKNVANTVISNNNISRQIGLITLDMVEGPYGYGISVRNSGVNISITDNLINENYMGIFLDAANSTGIVITGNEIRDSIIEGFTANENYTPVAGAKLIVENNALYNNAKGPSLMILGEVSANPAGIYGPGEWNDDLKLELGSNWYGTTLYTKWSENNTGPGTLCPRIKTSLITFNLTYLGNGGYEATFYNNGKIASELPDFTYYMTLNYYTDKEQEVLMHVHDGKGTFSFSSSNYLSSGNVIEGSSGSLRDDSRPFRITYTYNVPDSEIPR